MVKRVAVLHKDTIVPQPVTRLAEACKNSADGLVLYKEGVEKAVKRVDIG